MGRPQPESRSETTATPPPLRPTRIFSCLHLQILKARTDPARARITLLSSRPLQPLVAFGIIATALLDPFQAAIRVRRLVGIVLIVACLEALFAGAQAGIFGINGRREDGV